MPAPAPVLCDCTWSVRAVSLPMLCAFVRVGATRGGLTETPRYFSFCPSRQVDEWAGAQHALLAGTAKGTKATKLAKKREAKTAKQ